MTRNRFAKLRHLTCGSLTVAAMAGAVAPGCLSRPLDTIDPRTTSGFSERFSQFAVDKIDILFAIDDSGSMGDKQDILAQAVPDLVRELVNPPCVDAEGTVTARPAGPDEVCPDGSQREHRPVSDIHIGVVDSSLGSSLIDNEVCRNNLATLRAENAGDRGFMLWAPDSDEADAYGDMEAMLADLSLMVRGIGEDGCGHEASLESWYRFLVDPDADEQVEAQRAKFLRPDSLVAVVMLSDENDCSFQPGVGSEMYGKRARRECATDPSDPCCAPCGEAPEVCAADPTCDAPLEPGHDNAALACFHQKQRYGESFLQPVERYIDGLTKVRIRDAAGNEVNNPLFVRDGFVRSSDRVLLTGIVGVPWQRIARDAADASKGFKSAAEMVEDGAWDVVLGDPDHGVNPSEPRMIESHAPRAGLPGPTSAPDADPIHGHEHTTDVTRTLADLQYACIFELKDPIVCDAKMDNCDCDNSPDSPLCQDEAGNQTTTQRFAKAYPSTRQLSVMKGLGAQAIVGSICPAQMTDDQADDYGYRPTMEALLARLKDSLRGACLNRSLTPDARGQVACVVLEGRKLAAGDACDCSGAGRAEVVASHQAAADDARAKAASSGLDCFCEVEQLGDSELRACQNDEAEAPMLDGAPVDGWCYVDASSFPKLGNEKLVEDCLPTERRTIRFVGEGQPKAGTQVFISCQQ